MTVRAYPAYRESGVGWIGLIPKDWRFQRVLEAVNLINGFPFDSALFAPEGGMPLIRIRDLNQSQTDVHYIGLTVTAVEVTNHDLLIGMDGEFNVGRWKGVEVALLNQRVCCLRGSNSAVRWMEYALPIPLKRINDLTYSTTVKHLSSGQVRSIRIPTPSTETERDEILEFLDRETGKIDALVAEQERLIALLKEKRQAVISHAVTKGLNPNAPMKDSGVPWLGEVPQHWLVGRCSYYFDVLAGFAFASEGFSQDDADTRLMRGTNVGVSATRWDDVVYWRRAPNDSLDDYELFEGDLVLGMDRPWISTGVRVAKLTAADVPSLLLQRVARISALGQVSTDILELMLSSEFFRSHFGPDMTGVSVPHISPDQVGDFKIPVPPESEQAGIVAYTREIQHRSDRLVKEVTHAIALLRERRAALISAAVTGKIDVRDTVAQPSSQAA